MKTVLFFNKPPPLPQILQNIVTAPLKLLQGASSGNLEVCACRALHPTQTLTMNLSFVSLTTQAQKTAVLTVLAPGVRDAQGIPQSPTAGAPQGVVMVVGATGGVGSRVVRMLLQQGTTVRALVRDVAKATELLVRLMTASHVPNTPGCSLMYGGLSYDLDLLHRPPAQLTSQGALSWLPLTSRSQRRCFLKCLRVCQRWSTPQRSRLHPRRVTRPIGPSIVRYCGGGYVSLWWGRCMAMGGG